MKRGYENANGSRRRRLAWIVVAGLFPMVALFLLFAAEIPIGQPFFLIYRYSPWIPLRIPPAIAALVIGFVGIAALHRAWFGDSAKGGSASPLTPPSPPGGKRGLSAHSKLMPPGGTGRRHLSWGIAGLSYAALVGWTFVAPPHFVEQHSFNMLSPSQDGAFVLEARTVISLQDYLSEGFLERLEKTPEDMRGRRVLSNPPAVTIGYILLERWMMRSRWVQSTLIELFALDTLDDSRQQAQFAAALLFAMLLMVAWGLAFMFAYRLGRLWLAVAPAIALAFASVFNPATVSFTPGKDPAQLLSTVALMWLWMSSYVSGRPWKALAAGLLLPIATMIGLVHALVFANLAGSTALHACLNWPAKNPSLCSLPPMGNRVERRPVGVRGLGQWLRFCAVPSACGAVIASAMAYFVLDWNIPLTAYRVAVRYAEIQLPAITDPFHWTLVGLPMFLLFVGPMFWIHLVAIRRDLSDAPARLGLYILTVTIAIQTYCYFFANNSETPRLWMPFIPFLLTGMALRRSDFRADSAWSRRLHLVLLALQLVVTVAFWSLLDVRESEFRLATGRMWD